MPLKNPELTKFTTASQTVASYNSTELISGQGFITFNAYDTQVAAGQDHHISSNAGKSKHNGTSGSGDPTAILDVDFDTSAFNAPRVIEGIATVSLGWGFRHDAGGAGTADFAITLRKVSGGVETDLVTVSLAQENWSAAATGPHHIEVMPLTIPRTQFKKGDQLRFNVLITVGGTGGNKVPEIGHDPENGDYGLMNPTTDVTATTQLILKIPFDIDF